MKTAIAILVFIVAACQAQKGGNYVHYFDKRQGNYAYSIPRFKEVPAVVIPAFTKNPPVGHNGLRFFSEQNRNKGTDSKIVQSRPNQIDLPQLEGFLAQLIKTQDIAGPNHPLQTNVCKDGQQKCVVKTVPALKTIKNTTPASKTVKVSQNKVVKFVTSTPASKTIKVSQNMVANPKLVTKSPAPKTAEVTQEIVNKFTIDSCKYFATIDCDETCGLCHLCSVPGFSGRSECSSQCAGGVEKCTKSCKVGQEQCLIVTSRFTELATSIIIMDSDFSEFSELSELAMDSCDSFSSFDCTESCGLCNLCNLVPGGSKRPECSMLCVSGINTCTSVCEAGQSRCANAVQLATALPRIPKTSTLPKENSKPTTDNPVIISQETEFSTESCNNFSKFDCMKTCELCKFCDRPDFDITRPECSTHCANGIEACTKTCNDGQARCLIIELDTKSMGSPK